MINNKCLLTELSLGSEHRLRSGAVHNVIWAIGSLDTVTLILAAERDAPGISGTVNILSTWLQRLLKDTVAGCMKEPQKGMGYTCKEHSQFCAKVLKPFRQ